MRCLPRVLASRSLHTSLGRWAGLAGAWQGLGRARQGAGTVLLHIYPYQRQVCKAKVIKCAVYRAGLVVVARRVWQRRGAVPSPPSPNPPRATCAPISQHPSLPLTLTHLASGHITSPSKPPCGDDTCLCVAVRRRCAEIVTCRYRPAGGKVNLKVGTVPKAVRISVNLAS